MDDPSEDTSSSSEGVWIKVRPQHARLLMSTAEEPAHAMKRRRRLGRGIDQRITERPGNDPEDYPGWRQGDLKRPRGWTNKSTEYMNPADEHRGSVCAAPDLPGDQTDSMDYKSPGPEVYAHHEQMA